MSHVSRGPAGWNRRGRSEAKASAARGPASADAQFVAETARLLAQYAPGHIYVIEFVTGVVTVGEQRLASHQLPVGSPFAAVGGSLGPVRKGGRDWGGRPLTLVMIPAAISRSLRLRFCDA